MRSLRLAISLFVLLALPGCIATPLPEPPSADPGAMTLTETQPAGIRLAGTSGAITPGSIRMRVTDPSTAATGGRVEVDVGADGAFGADLPGATTDVLYLEQVGPDRDLFFAAVQASGTAAVSADPGPDSDGDGSPDAIDCAPLDRTLIARECATTGTECASDADCDPSSFCMGGTCQGCMANEICSNGFDDNCNGTIDEMPCM